MTNDISVKNRDFDVKGRHKLTLMKLSKNPAFLIRSISMNS